MNAGAADLHAILAFYVESGVDAVLQEEPTDRLSGDALPAAAGVMPGVDAMPGRPSVRRPLARRRYRRQPRVRPQRCGG